MGGHWGAHFALGGRGPLGTPVEPPLLLTLHIFISFIVELRSVNSY